MKKISIFLAVLFVFFIFSNLRASDESLEYKLAVINAKGYVSKDHITVKRFRSLLNQLSKTFVENKEQIADMSVAAQKRLEEEGGVEESVLNIMEGMNKIFTEPIENQKYAEYVAAYTVMRIKGNAHEDSINGLKLLIRSLK